MGYFPVYLDLRGRSCVVIGGGREAEEKAERMVVDGARVTVVWWGQSEPFERMAAEGLIDFRRRHYESGDLHGAFLALAATTGDLPLSEAISEEAAREGVLLNVVDVTRLCTWIYPAIVRRGDVTVAISTNGRSPAMAKRLRLDIEDALPPVYGPLLDLLAEVRVELSARGVRPPAEAWQRAITGQLLQWLEAGDLAAAREWIADYLAGAARSAAG